MPNYCFNVLKISNDDVSKIDALEKAIKDRDGVFQHLRPNPAGEDADNWYEWNRENWGTKWDIDTDELTYSVRYAIHGYGKNNKDNKDTISMTFNTAWCPPIELYNFLHEAGWVIEAYYMEEGEDFVGMYTDGESADWEISKITNKDYYNKLPQKLIDNLDLEIVRNERLEDEDEDEDEEDEENEDEDKDEKEYKLDEEEQRKLNKFLLL